MPILTDESPQALLDETGAPMFDELGEVPYALQAPMHAGQQITFETEPITGDSVTPVTGGALLILNTGPAAGSVSLPLPPVDGVPAAPRVVTVPAGAVPWMIPLPPAVYGHTPVTVTYSGDLAVAWLFIP